jgi:uncharacterized protein YigA (DUF484 family)
MSNHAMSRVHVEEAAEAVKAYIRMNRASLAEDGELLALLLPERFEAGGVRDLQRFVIDRLSSENQALRMELHGLLGARERVVKLGDGVRRAVLELVETRSFDETVALAAQAAPAFGATCAAICMESAEPAPLANARGMRFIKQGTIGAILGANGARAVLAGGGAVLIGPEARDCRILSVFRMRISPKLDAAYVLGAANEGSIETDHATAEIGYFAHALERAIRRWLGLPRL